MNEASHPSPGPTRVLLVECNATLRVGLQAWLQQEFPHQKIDTASSRELAEKLATEHPPALVLVDIDALRGEGFATLRSLGALLPEALFVALSLYPVDYFREPATQAGAVGCACIALSDNRLRDLLRGLLHLPQGRVP